MHHFKGSLPSTPASCWSKIRLCSLVGMVLSLLPRSSLRFWSLCLVRTSSVQQHTLDQNGLSQCIVSTNGLLGAGCFQIYPLGGPQCSSPSSLKSIKKPLWFHFHFGSGNSETMMTRGQQRRGSLNSSAKGWLVRKVIKDRKMVSCKVWGPVNSSFFGWGHHLPAENILKTKDLTLLFERLHIKTLAISWKMMEGEEIRSFHLPPKEFWLLFLWIAMKSSARCLEFWNA